MTQSTAATFTWMKFLLNLLVAILAFLFILVLAFPIGFYGMAMYISPSLPSLDDLKKAKLSMPLQIYTEDNQLIGQYGNDMSLPVSYEQIPKNMVNAFLAAEDSSFFQHSGISIKGIGRALTEAVSDDDSQTGGSTITQQVAKNYFLSSERTLNRKLTELFLARKIEEKLSKQDIMTLYVNKIYLGQGAYGIKAAAKQYYSKSLNNLTIAEMAMIAGLPKAPSKYNPVANPERALERRNWILGQMLKNGAISQVQHDEAVAAPIGLRLYQAKLDKNLPYLAEMTRASLVEQYGEAVINSGWRVKLTINSEAQEIAENAIKRGLFAYDRRHGWRGAPANTKDKEKPGKLANFPVIHSFYPVEVTKVYPGNGFDAVMKDGTQIKVPWSNMRWATLHYRNPNSAFISNNIVNLHDIVYVTSNADNSSWSLVQIPAVEGSLVSVNPETGALLAVVGGFDFNKSKFNRAIQGYRQPGSTIKPLVYATALEKGFSPDTMISDDPLTVGSWKPKNSDGRNLGMIPLRKGLYLSRNLVSIRVLRSAGISDTRELLNEFGLEKERMPNTLSLALGSGEATPLQMATGYATFANGGHRIQPYFIQQIFDYNGKLQYQANPKQACAVCFNNDLQQTNEDNLTAFQEQQTALLSGQSKDTQAGDKATEKSDLFNANPLAKTNEKDSLNKQDKKKLSKEEAALEASTQQMLARQASLEAQLYDAGPDTDKLKPMPIQYIPAQQAPRILSSNVAFQMANILRDVIQRGTAVKARALGRSDLGGKTGTTNDAKDAWFAGINPRMVTTVWVGFDQPIGMGKKEFGGVAALPIWMDFTSKMLKGEPVEWVSVNNRAKSKKQEQETIELTDNGTRRVDSKGNEITRDDSKPPQAVTRKRPEEQASVPMPTTGNNINYAQLNSNKSLNE